MTIAAGFLAFQGPQAPSSYDQPVSPSRSQYSLDRSPNSALAGARRGLELDSRRACAYRLFAAVFAFVASTVLPVEGRAATCSTSPAPDAREVVPLKFTGPNVFSVPITLGEGPASKTLDMTVDTGAAISGVPTGVADALIAAEQAVELQKRTVTLFAGYSDTFRTIRIKTIRVGCQVVPDVIAIVLNAQVIGLPALGHSGRFTIDGIPRTTDPQRLPDPPDGFSRSGAD